MVDVSARNDMGRLRVEVVVVCLRLAAHDVPLPPPGGLFARALA